MAALVMRDPGVCSPSTPGVEIGCGGCVDSGTDPDAAVSNWETEAGDDWLTETDGFWLLDA